MFYLCSRNFPTSTPVTYRGEYPPPPGLSVQMRAQLIILISCQIMSKLASLKNRLRIDYLTFTRKLMRFPAWLQMPVKIWSILFSIRGCKFCSKMQVLPSQVLRCLKTLSIVFCLNFCQQNFDYPNCLASEKIKGLTANQTRWCLQSCF